MKRLTLACCVLAFGACSTTADSTAAGVRLTITRDAALDIDAVRVRALDGDRQVVQETREADGGMLAQTETLPLVFDGAPNGAKVRIEVEGLAGGDVLATSETTATLRLGKFVDAEVHLGGGGGGAEPDGGLDGGPTGGPDASAGSDGGADAAVDASTPECSPNGKSRVCGASDVGECKKGTQTCTDGAWSACKGEVEASDEACPADGKDQDCNGTDDDGDNSCGGVCTLANDPDDWCDATGDADNCPDDTYACNGLNAVACVEGTPGLVKWATNVGDVQWDGVYAIDAADDASLFVTGVVTKDGAGTTEIGGHEITTFANFDVFVARVDPTDGSVVWAEGAGGAGNDIPWGIAAAPDASAVYVVGEYRSGMADFGTRTLQDADTLATTYFLAKYEGSAGGDGDSDVLWAVDAGGTGYDQGEAVAVGPDGSVYVTGVVENDIGLDVNFGDNASGTPVSLYRPCNGGQQLFVAKYSSDGKVVWVAGSAADPARTSDGAHGAGIDVDAAGNVYVTGSFSGIQVRFCDADASRSCPETVCNEVLTSQDHAATGNFTTDVFVAKYDSDGNVQWVTRAGQDSDANPDIEVGHDVASDGTTVYVTGTFDGFDIAFCKTPDPPGACDSQKIVEAYGLQDMFIAAYAASSGAFQWARNAGANGKITEAFGLAMAADGSVRVAGSFQGTAAFGLVGEDCYTQLVSASGTNDDVFLARYEPNGDLRWVRRAGASGTEEGRDVAVLPNGDAFTAGFITGASIPFCHVSAGCTVTASSAGMQDGFVARFGP